MGLRYANESDYPIVSLRIRFTQRDDVTDEQRAVFDSMYAEDSSHIPPISADELYVDALNQHFSAPGEEVDPWACELSYSLTSLTMAQFELMRPDMALIRFIGEDGGIYSESYDFLNDSYELQDGNTERTISSEDWPTGELPEMMPQMNAAAITVERDEADSFEVLAYGATEDDFLAYVEQCKSEGFNNVVDSNSMNYMLQNDEGYSIEVTYYKRYDYFYSVIVPPEA